MFLAMGWIYIILLLFLTSHSACSKDVSNTCTSQAQSEPPSSRASASTPLRLTMTNANFSADCLKQIGSLPYCYCKNFNDCCDKKCTSYTNVDKTCRVFNDQIDERGTSCICSSAGDAFVSPKMVWLIPILGFVKNWHRWTDN